MRLAASLLAAGLVAAAGCAPGAPSAHGSGSASARALYKPGASLAARLCECRECFEASCCDGAPDSDETPPASSTELGLTLTACGRCVRRTWTARGTDPCQEHAPRECCAGSVDG